MAWYSGSIFQPEPASIKDLFSSIQKNLQNNLLVDHGQIPMIRFPGVFLFYNLKNGEIEVKEVMKKNPSIVNDYSTLCKSEINTAVETLRIIAKLQLLTELSKLGDPDINKHIPKGRFDQKVNWQEDFLQVDAVLADIHKTTASNSNPVHIKVATALDTVGIKNIKCLEHVDNIVKLMRDGLQMDSITPRIGA